MFDDSRRQASRFTDFPIGGVVLELKREEFERQFVKLVMARLPRSIPQEREKAGGKV